MKTRLPVLLTAVLLALAWNSHATLRYVDLTCTNPTPPFLDWTTAATNIQDAVDASVDGDQILVTNGVYQTGGKVMYGDLTNRVVLDKAVTVQSVNGPWATTLLGAGAVNGTAAVRCAWLTNGASLVGFTLQAGATRSVGDSTNLQSGGAVWCASTNAFVANCLILSNAAPYKGGGVYQGSIRSSLVLGNTGTGAAQGGGAYGANLLNCTVLSNSPSGAWVCRLTNCIAYYDNGGDAVSCTMSYCCTYGATPGTGSFSTPPKLFSDGIHLNVGSPCIGTGTNFVSGTDIFGVPWANPPSIGCAEWQPGPLVTMPQVQITGVPVGFTVGNASVGGPGPLSYSWLKDGVPLQDDGHFGGTQTTNLAATGVSYADAGGYQLVVSNAFGMVTSAVARLVVHCVDAASANPVAPYSTWATAATNIQDAIAAALTNEVVLVTNGLYATGGKSMDGVITNRISLDKPLLVQSVNGPSVTTVQGALDPVSTNGPAAVRCAWLTNKAVLSGFTLFGGATRPQGQNQPRGGGVWAASTSAVVDHCMVLTNYSWTGGGAYQATLNNCSLVGNHALSGGAGGGAANCNLGNCVVMANVAEQGNGGGGTSCNFTNCSLTRNSSYMDGGAAYSGKLINCTVTGNSSSSSFATQGGVVYGATLSNCIVWGNQIGASHPYTNYASCTLAYCCSDPLPSGPGNMDVDPQLLEDGVHLAETSPCRGAGTSAVVSGTDIDGQPWNSPPSIGCDEWQPSLLFALQPSWQVNASLFRLTLNVSVAGQAPISYYWSKDGVPLQDDSDHSATGTATPSVSHFGPEDGGAYQVVVSNAFGVVTSQVALVVIHAVDAASAAPVTPYTSWARAAATIQDAITASGPGDIVLVTNGLYVTGGKVMAGDLTNRVALDKPVTVMGVNGPWVTIIQGAWDPVSTNGPGAVRCAWLTNGAVLSGFTLQNGATRGSGGYSGAPALTGGGVWCSGTNSVVFNCVLTNNSAVYGGGIGYGRLNNSLVIGNFTSGNGGGAYSATLNNCTVVYNNAIPIISGLGVGTYDCAVQNSIVVNNYDTLPLLNQDNYAYDFSYGGVRFAYSCTYPAALGSGNVANIASSPAFLDAFHISYNSAGRGAGNAVYSSGTDLDGEAWANPPSMGCDEPVLADLVGPLSVNLRMGQTNALVNRFVPFTGFITGRAAWVQWSFDDGVTLTNSGWTLFHQWTNPGDYTVTFTAFNGDNPTGVSTNLLVHVTLPHPVQLQSPAVMGNGFGFQFPGEYSANYTVQYATNLVPPVTWQTLTYFQSFGRVYFITDPAGTNGTRFYRVLAQ